MPLYEYKCDREECGDGLPFELRVSMSNFQDVQECPRCGGQSHRVVSANSRQSTNWAEPVSTKSPVLEKFKRR